MYNRRSIRMKGYDYTQPGMYSVTICKQERKCLFGKVCNGEMVLNKYGKIAEFTWLDLMKHNDNLELDEYIIMPNHVHGIISIVGAGSKPAPTRAGLEPAPTLHGLSEIVRQFKTFSAKRINQIKENSGVRLWQRNFYEHVIRGDNDLNEFREYIINNPKKWEEDKYYFV